MTWDEAIEALFRAPHADFVNERKRLAGELRPTDKAGAAKLNKLSRPPASAWAVNQLWWRARAEFQALLDTAKRVREGAMDALPQHKAALSALSTLAAGYLKEMGNAAQDATLRRVETSLAAIAAGGGFDPDPAGALTDDREPSGFLSLGIAPGGHVEPPPPPPPAAPSMKEALAAVAAAQRAKAELAAVAEQTTAEAANQDAERDTAELLAERAAREEAAEREAARKAAEVETARREALAAAAEVSRLEHELLGAKKKLEQAQARLKSLEG